jgi:hypothetical protein
MSVNGELLFRLPLTARMVCLVARLGDEPGKFWQ